MSTIILIIMFIVTTSKIETHFEKNITFFCHLTYLNRISNYTGHL